MTFNRQMLQTVLQIVPTNVLEKLVEQKVNWETEIRSSSSSRVFQLHHRHQPQQQPRHRFLLQTKFPAMQLRQTTLEVQQKRLQIVLFPDWPAPTSFTNCGSRTHTTCICFALRTFYIGRQCVLSGSRTVGEKSHEETS